MAKFKRTPTALYSIDELFKGFDPSAPESFAETPDFEIYVEFVADGGAASTNKQMVLERAEHDCSILQLLAARLAPERVVAMMGGHAVLRGSKAYEDTARAAAQLTADGFLVLTGGGPGAMEAAHLGAAIGQTGSELDDALRHMKSGPTDSGGLPVTYKREAPDPITIDGPTVKKLGEYYRVGWEVRERYPRGGGVAIPTWMYGWEPTTVFARDVGKYFQNSIREDGLLAAATHGIIYAEGSAGTLQEIFQDAAQNFYKSFPAPPEAGEGVFSPMVFLGDYWTAEDPARKTLPVKHLLDMLWIKMRNGPAPADTLVTYAASPDEAVAAIKSFPGLPASPTAAILRTS